MIKVIRLQFFKSDFFWIQHTLVKAAREDLIPYFSRKIKSFRKNDNIAVSYCRVENWLQDSAVI